MEISEILNYKNIKFVEIGIESSLSDEIISITGEIKDVKQHGFNLKSGALALYKDKDSSLAYFFYLGRKIIENCLFLIQIN